MKRSVADWHRAFPDTVNEVGDVLAEGDLVAARWVTRGTHRGEFLGLPASGRRVEVTSSVGRASRGAAMAGAGGAVLYAGLLVLLAAVVFGLIEAGLDAWLAALIVAAVTLVIGAIVTSIGVKQIQSTEMAPKQTAETVRENVEFVREQMK